MALTRAASARITLTRIAFALLATAGLAATPRLLHAQVGSSTDILTGRVTGPDGKPRANVEVDALSAETGITRKKRTDADGRYTILFPDGGGQYRMQFKAVGFEPVTRNVARQADEDRLIIDIQLGVVPTQLSTVSVNSRRGGGGRNTGERPTPGEAGRTMSSDQLSRTPVDQSDLAAVAALAPGVVGISGTDTTASSFSVAGQRSTLNNVTLDGLSFGNFTVPAEGMRATRVVTNTFDPAQGKFTGGVVSSTSRGGTNELTGGFTYSRRDPTLQYEGGDSAALAPTYLQDQISAGLGGPIIKDKWFIFGSAQFRRRSDPFQSILSASPSTLLAAGLSPDSVNRFINTVNGYGVPTTTSDLPGRRVGDNTTGLVRMDYFLNDGNTLTLRYDYHQTTQDPTRTGLYSLPTNTGTSTNTGSGIAATLSSVFESGIINEFKAYYTRSTNSSNGFLLLPAGRVRINSSEVDSTSGIFVLQFGGNPGLPQSGSTSLLELSNEASYLTKDRAHRIKLGGLLDLNRYNQTVTTNQYGTFTFNSLQDFVDNEPSGYTRTLTPQQRTGSSVAGDAYLGDTWRVGQAQFVYGLRAEATHVGDAPPLNQDVLDKFGYRTNDFPSEFHVSPRFGFTVNLTKPDPNDAFAQFRPAFVLRGGIGEFRAVTPTGLYTSAQGANGLPGTEQILNCIGTAVPTPDWSSYVTDPSTTPDACVGAGSSPFASVQRNVTVFDPNFQAPRAWRGSLGLQHRITDYITFSADASFAYGTALYGVTDLNLNTTPAFTLSDEGNRPVYTPAADIVPDNGAVSFSGSRVDDTYGQVLKLASNLHSNTQQLIMSMNGSAGAGMFFSLSYTLTRTRDQSTFTCCSASQGFSSPTTAGNPNVAEWAPSDQDIRHMIQALVTFPINQSFSITTNARLQSGSPFTPLVGSDINGDGARNDRAFIFDPATTTDPAVAAAMRQLLDGSSGRIRDCLESQLGQVAGRNSCRGPWTPSIDLQANFQPDGFGLHRKMTFSLVTSNLLSGLDELLHENLRGWGQPNFSDPTLLYVQSFDPVTQTFKYNVNGQFGSSSASRSVFRVPFVLALQAKLALGPDPRARFQQVFQSRIANAGSGGSTDVQNPIARLIQMKDTLNLTDVQVGRLTFLSDTLAAKTKEIGDSVRAQAQRTGMNNPRAVMEAIRPLLQEGVTAMNDAVAKAKLILTPEQWAKVPDDVKNPVTAMRRRRQM